MKVVTVEPTDPDKALLRTGAPKLEPTIFADTLIADPDGKPLAFVARYGGDLAALRRALLTYPPDTTMRMIGTSNRARTFGYTSRKEVLKRYGCRPCSGANVAPEIHSAIVGAASSLWSTYEAALPEQASGDLDRAQVIDAGWRMEDTPWTSGVVNFDSPLPYHFDANNLDCWSAMVVIRRFAKGGHLHIPQLGNAVIDCRDGDVLFFAGYKRLHAVTPVTFGPGGYRTTAVYYSVKAMQRCQPPDEELAASRAARSEMEDTLMDRQRADGMLK